MNDEEKQIWESMEQYLRKLVEEINFKMVCDMVPDMVDTGILWVESIEITEVEIPKIERRSIKEKIHNIILKVKKILKRKF